MGHGNVSVADPDLQKRERGGGHPDPEIRGGGGLKKEFFRPFRPHFSLTIRGAGLSPGSATLYDNEFETKENEI